MLEAKLKAEGEYVQFRVIQDQTYESDFDKAIKKLNQCFEQIKFINIHDFDLLVHTIFETHSTLQKSAIKAINTHLTIRNWLIGFYIVEFEQKGEDRAEYGSKLLSKLAQKIKIKGLTNPELSRCRQFYTMYPQIFWVSDPRITNN